jgi:hypothetical protein
MTTAGDISGHILEALSRFESPYMLVGSFSSNAYGPPRSTQDMDIVLRIEGSEPQMLLDLLGEDFFLEPQIGFETKFFTTKHLIRHRDSPFKIELFELSGDEHDRSRFDRREKIEVLGHEVWIATAEDVVIQKLRWNRRKDLDDVRGILALQGDRLDWPYIRRWTRSHGTQTRLDELLDALPEAEP